ncbi:DUF3040 domain-containing protein [Streptomyces sp. NPDC002133]|uniref:DUF3040 domain-containing protein n=1 Tax=Streptomyces sp. NPDC002133 TaxID=3154409 RepID=UPI0033259B38
MTQDGGNPLRDLEEQLEQSDLRYVRGLEAGRPRRPREYRRGPAWALLVLSVAMLVTGLVLPQGLILAAGLVTAGATAHLFAPPQDPAGHRPRLP